MDNNDKNNANNNAANNKNKNSFKYMKIAKIIFEMNLKDIIRVKNKGFNKIGVEFTNYKTTNEFVFNKDLINKGYKLYIPFNLVTCKGIIRRVDHDLSIEELQKMTKSSQKILSIVRIKRKIIKGDKKDHLPTGTIMITFKGINIPRFISISYLKFPVTPYVPPVTQCYKCLVYGHTSSQCKGKKKCIYYTLNHVTDNMKNVES